MTTLQDRCLVGSAALKTDLYQYTGKKEQKGFKIPFTSVHWPLKSVWYATITKPFHIH